MFQMYPCIMLHRYLQPSNLIIWAAKKYRVPPPPGRGGGLGGPINLMCDVLTSQRPYFGHMRQSFQSLSGFHGCDMLPRQAVQVWPLRHVKLRSDATSTPPRNGATYLKLNWFGL
jgi:hypothetical protein